MSKEFPSIEELAQDIQKVAIELGLNVFELTRDKYVKSGLYNNRDLAQFGGWGKIRAAYFRPEQDLAQVHSLKASAQYAARLENLVGSKLNLEKLVTDVISNLDVKISKRTAKVNKTKKSEKVDLVAILNDIHIGQIIDPEEIGGLNSFNFEQAGRRVAMFIKEVAEYKDYKRDQVGTLHLGLNGDLIQGIIHQITNHTQHLLTHQMNGALYILGQAIEYLRGDFEKIKVYGIPGNHDRMPHKENGKRAVNEVYDSYANILFFGLSAIFKSADDVTFSFPKTPYVFMDLPAGRAIMAHGDHIFSKAIGNPGKAINVQGLGSAIRDFNAGEISKGNQPVKLVILGHVHTFAHFITPDGVEVYVAPSLSGLDGFAHSLTINHSMSAQVVFESTSKFILGDSRLVRLHEADNDKTLDSIIPVYNKELAWV